MGLTVGFVFDDTLDVLDGVQQHIVMLGRELSRRGHTVHYLVGQTSHSPVPNTHTMSRNVMVAFNGNRMRIPLPASRHNIQDVLGTIPFDILHVQAPYSPFMAGRVLHAAHANTGVVATYHIAPANRLAQVGGMALGILNSPTHRRIDEVIAVSDVAAQYASLTAGAHGTIIPNPVDSASMRAAAGHSMSHRTPSAPHIVFLGRFVERKGAELLLDAVEYAQHHNLWPAGTHVTFAGKGPLLEDCRVRAATLTIPVEFAGFVAEEDKPALLASADVAVFPATGGESFGIVLLEAIASGAGVTLGGNNPGYRSTFRGDTDMLFDISPQGHARDLAHRIAHALNDQPWAHAVHDRQQQLLDRYDVTTVATQVEQIYARALERRCSEQRR